MARKDRTDDQTTDSTAEVSQGWDGQPGSDAPPPKSQAELDADKEPLPREQAYQLLRAGHRLRVKGGNPANWVSMTRHAGDLAISQAATQEAVDHLLDGSEFLLVD